MAHTGVLRQGGKIKQHKNGGGAIDLLSLACAALSTIPAAPGVLQDPWCCASRMPLPPAAIVAAGGTAHLLALEAQLLRCMAAVLMCLQAALRAGQSPAALSELAGH